MTSRPSRVRFVPATAGSDRSSVRLGRRRLAATVAAALIAAGCGGSSDDASDETTQSTAPALAAETSAEATDTTVAANDATGGDESAERESTDSDLEPEDLWVTLWTAIAAPQSERGGRIAELGSAVTPDVVDTIDELVSGGAARMIVNSPITSDNGDGTITIDDCLNAQPAIVDRPANWFRATASPSETGGWTIDTVELVDAEGCVPAAVADQVLAAFDDYVAALEVFWDPADPDHPLVEQILTGPELERTRATLTDLAAQGLAARSEEIRHPEVAQYLDPGTVHIVDCSEASPNDGVFDADGNRQPGIAEPTPGQRNIVEYVFVAVDGTWRLNETFGLDGADCEFAPTEQYGIPVVGTAS